MTYLFTDEQLAIMAEQVRQLKAVPPPPPTPPVPPPPTTPPPAPSAPEFAYRARPAYLWNRRAHQSRENFCLEPEPLMPVTENPEIEDGDVDDNPGEIPKSKVSSTTLCVCNHPKKDHHTAPEPHVADDDHAFYCITAHCAVYSRKDGISAPCDCQYFRVAETDPSKFTKPRVGPYDRCGNPACGHWRRDHCTASKPGKVNRLKPGEMAIRSLQKADGTWYGCKHFSLTDPLCQCTSTSCSHTSDGKEFCSCEKFANPWLVRKTRVPSGKPRARKPVAMSPAVAATGTTTETVLAKAHRTRKKKSTAFTTGETVSPSTATESQPTGEKG